MALPLLRSAAAPARRPHVIDPKRLLPAILLCGFALALWPSEAAAQRRGRPVRSGGSTVVVVRPSFYGGYYGYGYNAPLFWGYGGWYPYGLYAPYYPAESYSHNIGSARIQVTPKHAEVYVDGHLAGTVDDFDGFLQRLDVPAGEHELTLYLDGYRTINQKVLFRPGATIKISYAMEALPQGTPSEPRPQANPDAARARRRGRHNRCATASRRRTSARSRSGCSRATRPSSSTARSGTRPTDRARCWSSSARARTRSKSGSRGSPAIARPSGCAATKPFR